MIPQDFQLLLNFVRGFVHTILKDSGFTKDEITRFAAEYWKSEWTEMLEHRSRVWHIVNAAQGLLEETDEWESAWKEQRWSEVASKAFMLGRIVQLHQMVMDSINEKKRGAATTSAIRRKRNAGIMKKADKIERANRAKNKRELSKKELFNLACGKRPKISLKTFYRNRHAWTNPEKFSLTTD